MRLMDSQATTRDRIVQAAMELFWRKGYGSTSISDILETARVNSGSLYYFFKGKQELLVAVLEAYRDGIDAMLLEPSWRDVEDPVEKIFALLGTYRRLLDETDCFYGCPIGSLALELHEPDPEVRELIAANFANWTSAVRQCLDQVGLNDGMDTKGLAELVLTVMEGAVMQARTYRDISHYDRAVAQLRNYIDCLTRK
jgi:AcrR family transcriptional regulator